MELIIVLVIALLVLGPKKLPEVGRSVGKGMREFKDALSGEHDDDDSQVKPGPTGVTAEAGASNPERTEFESD
ncbi:twin-arginine translocase TatA/TatE family subunit [Paraconexibacter antarcticus]|uniref:Sec-independent protein translocase protein TatA n=2 Tax=Paraconexibacter antarcticus TaxID=2949664 RepID=A0ABY5DQ82_9ACTN|nr:twin-arginine translocase TatA/TatE family subunit [Paraconexibacter antarcticus]